MSRKGRYLQAPDVLPQSFLSQQYRVWPGRLGSQGRGQSWEFGGTETAQLCGGPGLVFRKEMREKWGGQRRAGSVGGGRSPPHPPPALRNSLPATWRAACWAHSCALDSAWAAVVTYHRLGPGTTVTFPQSQTFLLIWFLVCRRLLGISSYGLSSKCAGWEGEGEGREQAPVSLLIQTLIL